MKTALTLAALLSLFAGGCSRKQPSASSATPAAFGAAIVESSGGKQVAAAGTLLQQPVVVQINDDQGNAVTGAAVEFSGPRGVVFDPPSGVTDSSGQFTTTVSLGGGAGRYEITAITFNKSHKQIELKLQEIALDYQQVLGRRLNEQYCERCHNPESTPQRVSNYDNLEIKPHAFADGEFYDKMSDDDITALITHGGPALNKSPAMPPYGYTLSKSDIQALLAYIRAVSDPPFRGRGLVYAEK
jgi:mono/diheme cytochrome c family protein